MEDSFRYQLDLVVRLVDTTMGTPVTARQVLFTLNGQKLALLSRSAGTYVRLGDGLKNGKLTVNARGYLETAVNIRYEDLDDRYPEVYVDLISERPRYGRYDFMDISGNMPGITSVAAVCLTKPFAEAASYSAGKQQLKLLAARVLDEKAYALIHAKGEAFEEFHVASVRNRLLLRLAHPLETEVKPKQAISRIVRGRVEGDGDYLLRLRGDGQGMQYLVRYVVSGKTKFKKIDQAFVDDPGNRRL